MPPPPRRRDAALTRQSLLETATRHFAEQGLEGARIDEIAADAGANKRMIYVYFGSKEDLYAAVLQSLFERVFTALSVPSPGDPPPERVRQAIRSYFHFLAANDALVRLMARELLSSGRRASEALVDRVAEGLKDVREALAEGVRTGAFLPGLDIRQVMLSIQALCLGHLTHQPIAKVLLKRDLTRRQVREATASHIAELVLRGICASPSSPDPCPPPAAAGDHRGALR
jgi:TetR/AcrR family transcriptional regulator